ncbi:uncharacterized protein RCH25_052706 [Pelodytes ibericus]
MQPRTVTSWLLFLLFLKSSHALDSIQVISGVFLASETNLDYQNASTTCARTGNASLANLEQVTKAFKNGFDACKWGWIQEQKIVMLRLSPAAPCGNYSLGILTKDCPGLTSSYTFCIKKNGNSSLLYDTHVQGLITSYDDARLTCTQNGDSMATQEEIQTTLNRNVTLNRDSWYDWGVGSLDTNGKFQVSLCPSTNRIASGFCYNPDLPDNFISVDNTTAKRIAMVCVLASIFIILLIAGFFMKGNQFICCVEDRHSVHPDIRSDVISPTPKWNTNGMYKQVTPRKNSKYVPSDIVIEKRPAVIRPDVNYKTHMYSNMGYDQTTD